MATTTKLTETVTNKISAGYLKRIDDACTELRYKWEQLEEAVTGFNDRMKAEFESTILPALAEYNDEVEKANDLRQEIADEMQNFYDNKSEKWQEGDKGQSYLSWMEQWQDSFETVSIDEPGEVDFDVENYADKLGEELPFEVEG